MYYIISYKADPEAMASLRRCTQCAQIPMRATWFPLGASPLGEEALSPVLNYNV